jgi:hypothetical protein
MPNLYLLFLGKTGLEKAVSNIFCDNKLSNIAAIGSSVATVCPFTKTPSNIITKTKYFLSETILLLIE